MDITLIHATQGAVAACALLFLLDGAWLLLQDKQQAWKIRKYYKSQNIKGK